MPRFIKRLLEQYLNVPQVRPGEDTQWRFTQDWPAWLPEGMWLPALLVLLVFIAAVYWKDARSAGWRTRLVLILLRVSQLALLAVFFSNVTLSVDGTELPAVVVLIDRSASMKLDDYYEDRAQREAVEQLSPSTGSGETPSRLNLAKAILTRSEGRFLKRLLTRHRLHIYEFAGEARRFGPGEFLRPEEIDRLLPRLKNDLQPDGEVTNPRAAVERVLEDFSGSPPAALILFSDGIATSGEKDRLETVRPLLEKHGVPLFVVALGSGIPARDLQLSGLLAPEVAFANDPLTFSADLQVFGVDSRFVTLRLRQKGRAGILATRQIKLPVSGKKGRRVELTYTPREPGEGVEFLLEAVPLPHETNTRNNVQTVRVSIRKETLKVLLADSAPRYEFRYLKHLLEREKTITLHVILQQADADYAGEDATARPLRGRFPLEQQQLLAYDAIIVGDVDFSVVPEEVLRNLLAYVRAGGSLIFVAGPSYNPVSYTHPALKTLLPFDVAGVRLPDENEIFVNGFRPLLTHAGRLHPAFQLADSREANARLWEKLPPFYWVVEVGELKPAAQVLAEHPARLTQPDEEGNRRRLPVIILQRLGAGKVLYHATDDLWRWRRLVGDLYYGRYWVQLLRSLCRSKLIGQSRTAELETDRRTYTAGQNVRLTLRFYDKQRLAETHAVTVVVERNGTEIGRMELRQVPHLPHVFSGQLPGNGIARLPDGQYRAWVVSPFFEKGAPSATFTVNPPLQEMRDRATRTRELLAVATPERFFTPANAGELPARLPAGEAVPLNNPTSIPLWNRWELMLLFAGLLTTEWILRKRLRLI